MLSPTHTECFGGSQYLPKRTSSSVPEMPAKASIRPTCRASLPGIHPFQLSSESLSQEIMTASSTRLPTRAWNLIPECVVYLENKGIEFDGIKFYSVPARPYLKTSVTIPADVDFLITHGPAYSYLDRDLGCKQLFLSLASARPKYHIFGHVHEEDLQRKAILGGTTFLNVSYFEELRKNR